MNQAESLHFAMDEGEFPLRILSEAQDFPLLHFVSAERVVIDNTVDSEVDAHLRGWLQARIGVGLRKLAVVDLRGCTRSGDLLMSAEEDLLRERAEHLIAENTVEEVLVNGEALR